MKDSFLFHRKKVHRKREEKRKETDQFCLKKEKKCPIDIKKHVNRTSNIKKYLGHRPLSYKNHSKIKNERSRW